MNKAGHGWPSKSDDFFPYSDNSHSYWTGYFTSRAALKRYERHSNNILQVARQLGAFSNLQAQNALFYLSNKTFSLHAFLSHCESLSFCIAEAMGVAQHHDAVSGTEKQEVAFDYAQRLSKGIDIAKVNPMNRIFRISSGRVEAYSS